MGFQDTFLGNIISGESVFFSSETMKMNARKEKNTMNKETKESLMQIGELVKEEKHNPRQRFMRVKDVCKAYHMSRPKIMEEALSAGALYRLPTKDGTIKGTIILINVERFDEYLENFRIPGEMM